MSVVSVSREERAPVSQAIWCVGTRPDGEACGARAMRGSEYCYWHDPATEQERLSGLVRHERLAGAPVLPEAVPLETVADVKALLQHLALYLATGTRVEPRRATALNAVATQLLRAIEIGDMEAELAAARAEVERLERRCAEYKRALSEAGVAGELMAADGRG